MECAHGTDGGTAPGLAAARRGGLRACGAQKAARLRLAAGFARCARANVASTSQQHSDADEQHGASLNDRTLSTATNQTTQRTCNHRYFLLQLRTRGGIDVAESFGRWKALMRKSMYLDKQIIGTLPGDKIVVSE